MKISTKKLAKIISTYTDSDSSTPASCKVLAKAIDDNLSTEAYQEFAEYLLAEMVEELFEGFKPEEDQ
jgi:hypothetical protein